MASCRVTNSRRGFGAHGCIRVHAPFVNDCSLVLRIGGYHHEPTKIHGVLVGREIAADKAIIPYRWPRTAVRLKGDSHFGIGIIPKSDTYVGIVLPGLDFLLTFIYLETQHCGGTLFGNHPVEAPWSHHYRGRPLNEFYAVEWRTIASTRDVALQRTRSSSLLKEVQS